MQRADAAGMASAPGFEEIERFGPTHLADGNAIRAQPERGAHQVRERGGAILGAQRNKIGRGALQLARILDQHHAIAGFGDFGEERVDQRRLAG